MQELTERFRFWMHPFASWK